MRLLTILILLALQTCMYGGVTLINDSPFVLTAVIQTYDGTFLAQKVLQPGEQKNQVTNLKSTELKRPNYGYDTSITPYTVIWKCSNGGYYSVCSSVSPGALVKANSCPGPYYCKPKPKKDKKGKCYPCPCK